MGGQIKREFIGGYEGDAEKGNYAQAIQAPRKKADGVTVVEPAQYRVAVKTADKIESVPPADVKYRKKEAPVPVKDEEGKFVKQPTIIHESRRTITKEPPAEYSHL